MTITIDINSYNPIPDIKRWYRKWVCKRKGHKYEKYKANPVDSFYDRFMFRTIGMEWREPYKRCTRCYKTLYKKDKEKKPSTISFRRYKELK